MLNVQIQTSSQKTSSLYIIVLSIQNMDSIDESNHCGDVAPILLARAPHISRTPIDRVNPKHIEVHLKPKSTIHIHADLHLDLAVGANPKATRGMCTPVFLESHGRPKEWDVVCTSGSEDGGKRKTNCKAPYALIQHFAPGQSSAILQMPRPSNYVRVLGVFDSAAVAHALVDALLCPVRNNFPACIQTQTWHKFGGWDALNLAKPFHFILLCHDQPVEVCAFDIAELPNHCPWRSASLSKYPPGCKVSQQEFGVVRFRPWWSQADEKRRHPNLPFSNRLLLDRERIMSELNAVQEVHACVVTRGLAEEHALETLRGSLNEAGSSDMGNPINANLIAVVKLYEWLELPSNGGNGVLWQDMRLRRTVQARREDIERYHLPQRRPEKEETSARMDKRHLYEALQKVRSGKLEIKQDTTHKFRSSNLHDGDEKASVIEARLNRLRNHVASTNTKLQDLNKMAIIPGTARRTI